MNGVARLNVSPGGRRPAGAAPRGPSGGAGATTRLDGPDGLLTRARGGDAAAREDLLGRYTPFVLKVASRVTGAYVRMGHDDEASVALAALNEAIDNYDPDRGASFLGFAEAVIRRRLIDYYRQGKARRRETPVGALVDGEEVDGEGAGGPPASRLAAAQLAQAEWVYRDQEDQAERRDEVLRYREMLAVYGISLAELVRISPRHEDARKRAVEAARVLASRPQLVEILRRRGELPLRELGSLVGISRKTLERQRKYIIAVTLILTEDLPQLEAYLK